ncbi:IS630 family transposase, partial [Vibrio alginolyticus]
MKITLTNEQKLELQIQHSTTRDGRVRDRIKAVIHASNGWSPEEIADALLIHESTVRQHIKDYLQSNKLKPENGGSQSKLSANQAMYLIEHLTENTYFHTHQIVAYVKETFDLDYTVSGMNKWLHHNGFSYKQPKGVPHKFDEAKQQAFIEAYKALKASCGKDESIIFIDAVHPTLSTKLSHGWIRTGQDKVLETTGNRSRLNIIGALNLSDIGATIVSDYESINSENIVRFFCKLRESYPLTHKLHIILDGAGYHRSDLVRDAAFVLNIELHYLPPYSPNLNPIERLWKVMNEKSRNNVYFKNKRDFREAIDQFFTVTLPEIAGSLTSRINDNFQVLKPA